MITTKMQRYFFGQMVHYGPIVFPVTTVQFRECCDNGRPSGFYYLDNRDAGIWHHEGSVHLYVEPKKTFTRAEVERVVARTIRHVSRMEDRCQIDSLKRTEILNTIMEKE